MAYLLGMPVRTLNHHVKYDRCPKIAYDSYDPASVIQWYAEYLRAKLREAQAGSSQREARRRIDLAKAESAELDLKVKRGEFRSEKEMEHEYGAFVYACRQRLLSIGTSLASRVLGCSSAIAVKKIIDDEVWDALTELSRTLIQQPGKRLNRRQKKARHPKA
jgi:hypothetical protein